MEQSSKSKEATHPYAYRDKEKYEPLTAEDEYIRLKENNLEKPVYYSFATNEELVLIDGFEKKKVNKKTGKPIKVKPFFKRKDINTKNNEKSMHRYTAKQVINESLLHNLAKASFGKNKLFTIKGLQVENILHHYDSKANQYINLLNTDTVVVSEVSFEKELTLRDANNNSVVKRPDITLECYHVGADKYFTLYVEISVKHKKSREDKQLFRRNNLNVLEINIDGLTSLMNGLSDTPNDDKISPKKLLNIINYTVLSDTSKQTWLSNTLENKYLDIVDNCYKWIKPIERCNYRDKGQEGMLNNKCERDTYGSGYRTIINKACFKCPNYIGVIGDYDYLKDINKETCEIGRLPHLVCCDKQGIFKESTDINGCQLEINIDSGYSNL